MDHLEEIYYLTLTTKPRESTQISALKHPRATSNQLTEPWGVELQLVKTRLLRTQLQICLI
jgi:hypothetical protein